jgi:putative ABC transport system permease protein
MRTLLQDLRYGVRMLMKNPGFTLIAVLSLALGIGANTAIFSAVNAVLLQALPFPKPDRLVMVWEDASELGFPRGTPAPANYADWKAQQTAFAALAALNMRSFNLTGDGEPERVAAYGATADFFSLLGVQPLLGRTFLPEEDQPGAPKVVVLSYMLWQQRYGGERSVIGRELLLNGEKYTVVGIMPAGFQFMDSQTKLWVPMAFTSQALAQRNSHYLIVVGRLKPAVTLAQANADIQTITRRIAHDHPNEAAYLKAYVLPLREQLAGEIRRPLLVLLVAVGFVLLIACANIASLLLARTASRRREIAVRAALGASRWRVVQQLLTESLLLSLAGAALAVLLASWSFSFLQRLIPDGLALSTALKLDLRVLDYTLLITLVTGIVFGLAPALQASKVDLHEALKRGGGRSVLGAGGKRLRSALVVAEVALALVLLVGAGLLIQTLFKLRHQYSGLQPENVLIMRTQLPGNKYREQARRTAFYEQVLEGVKALPGINSAGYTLAVPLDFKGGSTNFGPEGRTAEQAQAGGSYDAFQRLVTADYLKTMGIPLLRGRYFNESDNEQALPVAIINETMAREYWLGEDAVGKRFKRGASNPALAEGPWFTIVGVVGDVRQIGVDQPVKAEMYFPHRQINLHALAPRELVLRTAVDPLRLVASVRREIREVDPEQPVSNVRTMAAVIDAETAPRRVAMTLLTSFAALALLLATLGIYGVLAYFVVQHTPEIGIRLALGAQRKDVLKLVIGQGIKLALGGVAIGLVVSVVLTRLMQSLLYGVSATDPLTLAVIALFLAGVALLACYLPARRATRVDPLIALRSE